MLVTVNYVSQVYTYICSLFMNFMLQFQLLFIPFIVVIYRLIVFFSYIYSLPSIDLIIIVFVEVWVLG
jgi:hypothetical protein